MKKLFFFLALAGTTFLTSCNNDDDKTASATSLVLTSDVATAELGASFTFTVTNNLNANVTATSTLTANEVAVTGNVFTPTAPGTYTVTAVNGALTSAPVTVTVTLPANTFFVNNQVLTTEASLLVYLGTDDNNVNSWVAAAYNETTQDEVDVYFTSTQVDEMYIDFPTTGNLTLTTNVPGTTEAAVYYNTTEELDTATLTALSLNITAINVPEADGDPQDWTYNYSLTNAAGITVSGNFSGDWEFLNATGKGTSASKNIIKVSKSVSQKAAKGKFIKA